MRQSASLYLLLFLTLTTAAQRYSIYQNITTSDGLPSNYVFAVTEDENGYLWAGTDKGLCCYDGFRWQVWDKDNGLPGNYVNTVFSDKRGGLWLGISDKGYFHFTPSTKRLQQLPGKETLLAHSLQIDEEGNLYGEINTPAFSTCYSFQPGNMQKPEIIFRWKGGIPVYLKADAAKKQVYCVYTTEADLTATKKILTTKWPLRTKQLQQPYYNGRSIYHLSDSVMITTSDYFRFATDGSLAQHLSLFPRNNSYAYTYAASDGLYVYNIKTGYYYFNKQNQPSFFNSTSGLGTDYVNNIYETRDGTIIISTLGAGLQLLKNRYRKRFLTENRSVRTVLCSNGKWHLLAGDRIYAVAASAEALTDLGPAGTSTLSLFKKDDTLMVGTLKGIQVIRETKTSLQPLNFLEHNAGVSSIIWNNNDYIAGSYGGGIVYFQQDAIHKLQRDYAFKIVEKLIPLSFGFAALSYEDGVLLTNVSTGKNIQLTKKEGLPSNSVYCLFEENQNLYIGTKGGLSIYREGSVVKTLHFPGRFAQEKAIACFQDARKKIWVVSNHLLYLVTGTALMPLASYPLIDEDDIVTAAAYNPTANEVGIGSNKSFSIISLDAVHPNQTVTSPRLIKTILDGQYKNPSDLSIVYNFKNLQFTIAPLSPLPFTQNHFYYKLEGFSEEWKEVKDSLTISFTGLRPGNYLLQFKSVNADGYESEPLTLSAFTVQKPFWERWPFLALCILLIIAATVFIVRQMEKVKRRKKEATLLLQYTLQAERERIAKDLHDHLGANLATIIAQTDNIEARLYKGDVLQASHTVQNLSAQTRETMNVLRETIWAVQEKEHALQDFVLRIRTFLQRLFDATTIKWEVNNNCKEQIVLSPTQTLHLFRIIQEASHNILKHAGASQAIYTFAWDKKLLTVVIKDNGCGFTAAKPHTNGLVNMNERSRLLHGKLTVHKQPSVTLIISLPV